MEEFKFKFKFISNHLFDNDKLIHNFIKKNLDKEGKEKLKEFIINELFNSKDEYFSEEDEYQAKLDEYEKFCDLAKILFKKYQKERF